MLGEGLPGDEAAHALADVDVAILEDDLSLADDHQRGAAALHAFEDVVLCSLETGVRGKALVIIVQRERETQFSWPWDPAFSIPRN